MIQRLQRLLQTLKEWQWSRMLCGWKFCWIPVLFCSISTIMQTWNKPMKPKVMMDPANIKLHKDNPRVSKVVEKLVSWLLWKGSAHGQPRIMSQPVREIWHTKEAIFKKAGGAKWSSQQLESTWWKCLQHALNRSNVMPSDACDVTR